MLSSGCETSGLENGTGTLKLTNNSTNVLIVYISLEKGSTIKAEARVSISPGSYTYLTDMKTDFYTVYVEDSDGDGYVTKNTVAVRKDATVEVKFPGDFKAAN